MPTLQHLGKGTSQICPAQPQQGTPRRGQGLLERPLVTRLEYLKLRTCKNDLHQFANASSPIFTHSRLFQNSCLILKKGCQGELAVEEEVPWGSHAGVCVAPMALVQMISQANSSKPFTDRQSLLLSWSLG